MILRNAISVVIEKIRDAYDRLCAIMKQPKWALIGCVDIGSTGITVHSLAPVERHGQLIWSFTQEVKFYLPYPKGVVLTAEDEMYLVDYFDAKWPDKSDSLVTREQQVALVQLAAEQAAEIDYRPDETVPEDYYAG